MKPFWLSGKETFGTSSFVVRSPWDSSVVAEVSTPTSEQVEQAVSDLHLVRLEAQATAGSCAGCGA